FYTSDDPRNLPSFPTLRSSDLTLTNTDNGPTLTLAKVVTNNDGGTATPASYTLTAAAALPNAGRNFSDTGDSTTSHSVFAGTEYDLTGTRQHSTDDGTPDAVLC